MASQERRREVIRQAAKFVRDGKMVVRRLGHPQPALEIDCACPHPECEDFGVLKYCARSDCARIYPLATKEAQKEKETQSGDTP